MQRKSGDQTKTTHPESHCAPYNCTYGTYAHTCVHINLHMCMCMYVCLNLHVLLAKVEGIVDPLVMVQIKPN